MKRRERMVRRNISQRHADNLKRALEEYRQMKRAENADSLRSLEEARERIRAEIDNSRRYREEHPIISRIKDWWYRI